MFTYFKCSNNTPVFSCCPVQQHCIPSLSFPFGIPSLLWLVSSHEPVPAPLTASHADSRFLISTMNTCINYANVSHGDVWCHKVKDIKGGNTGRTFRSSVFFGRVELPLVPSLSFLTFKTFYLHKNLYNALEERENTIKHKVSSLIRLFHKICCVNSSCITAYVREFCLNYRQVEW